MKPLIGITTERAYLTPRDSQPRIQGALGSYVEAVVGAGGLPILIPLTLDGDNLSQVYGRLDGVLLPGGADFDPARFGARPHPAAGPADADRDRLEIDLIRRAVDEDKPLLGVCRGAQAINVALGGTLIQDIPTEHATSIDHYRHYPEHPLATIAHRVRVEEESRLAHILGAPIVDVNSRHHQALRELAPGLVVAARAPDGIVEAIELPGRAFVLGVQWHPENLQSQPEMKALFVEFVKACGASAPARGG